MMTFKKAWVVMISVYLSLCLMFGTAFAEEEKPKSVWDWFSQAVDDVSDWSSQAWDDTTGWVSEAATDTWDWASSAAVDTENLMGIFSK